MVEKNALVIQIYSDNVFTPKGEIDPQMEAVLKTLWLALVGDLSISSIQERRAPESDRCAL